MAMQPTAAWRFELVSLPHSVHDAHEAFRGLDQLGDDLHLVHTLRGRGLLHTSRGVFETTPDHVLAVPVLERCRWSKTAGEVWEMRNLHIRLYDADGLPVHERSVLPVSFQPTGLARIHRQLIRWQSQWPGQSWQGRTTLAAEVMTLVADYLHHFGCMDALDASPDPVMRQARRQIEHQAAQAYDALSLASAASLSVSQFNRRFRAAWGLSPKAYWQFHRIKLAKAMLQGTTHSVGRVALELGFGDIHYFSRWFAKLQGVPPAVWRRQPGPM